MFYFVASQELPSISNIDNDEKIKNKRSSKYPFEILLK